MARVLLVEDDILIGMMVGDMLQELGHTVVGPLRSAGEACGAVASGALDAAVLDVNLDDETSLPVADALEAAGIPYVFATGYGPDGPEVLGRGQAVLTKPFSKQALAAALAAILAPEDPGPAPAAPA